MSLKTWENNHWVVRHTTSSKEITNLLAIVDRDIKDATEGMTSPDWRFGIAYNAALKLCTVLLHASGYRATRSSHHYYTINALPLILGEARKGDAEYLDTCRNKRNIVEYDYVGAVTEDDVEELISFIIELRDDVRQWLKKHHAELLTK